MKKLEQIEVREGLLSLSAKSFVFQFTIKKFQHIDMENYNLACFFVWVWNLVSQIEKGTYAKGD